MSRLRQILVVSIVTGLALMFCWSLLRPKPPPIRMVVRGFITNEYQFFNDEKHRDYVLGIIEVTNRTKHSFHCQLPYPWAFGMSAVSHKAYYAWGDGGFTSHTMAPRSAFTFEHLVWRNDTNQVSLLVTHNQKAVWPFHTLPASVQQKLPNFKFFRGSKKEFTVETKPFTLNNRLE